MKKLNLSSKSIRNVFSRVYLLFLIACLLSYGFNPFFYPNISSKQEVSVDKSVITKRIDTFQNSNWKPIIKKSDNLFKNNYNHILNDPFKTIEYNLLTKTENIEENCDFILNQSIQTIIPPFMGTIEDYLSQSTIKYVFPPDDRERVTTTSIYPWRTICKLFITAQDNTKFIASAMIIDDFHILTCGHCIYIHDHGGWVSELEVIPGMDNLYEPFGHAYATYLRTYTGWTQNEMIEHDWAVVTLDRSIGYFTGWMGRRTADPSNSIYTGILNTAGYPYDLYNGYYMYFDADYGEDADEYNHWFWMDTAGGQSGSPVWQYDGENRYILSINAYEYLDGAYANFGTRLNQDKFDRINTWLSEDSPSPPDDQPDLIDRGSSSGINPSSVIGGETIFNIYCDVENKGTAIASSFEVDFYASEDLSITATDYLIGSTNINNLAPFSYISADWSGIFPSEIPEGLYFIGWIIDGDNDIDELNENNNIVIINQPQLNVGTKKGDSSNWLISFFLNPIVITTQIILVAAAIIVIALKKYGKRIPDNLDKESSEF